MRSSGATEKRGGNCERPAKRRHVRSAFDDVDGSMRWELFVDQCNSSEFGADSAFGSPLDLHGEDWENAEGGRKKREFGGLGVLFSRDNDDRSGSSGEEDDVVREFVETRRTLKPPSRTNECLNVDEEEDENRRRRKVAVTSQDRQAYKAHMLESAWRPEPSEIETVRERWTKVKEMRAPSATKTFHSVSGFENTGNSLGTKKPEKEQWRLQI